MTFSLEINRDRFVLVKTRGFDVKVNDQTLVDFDPSKLGQGKIPYEYINNHTSEYMVTGLPARWLEEHAESIEIHSANYTPAWLNFKSQDNLIMFKLTWL